MIGLGVLFLIAIWAAAALVLLFVFSAKIKNKLRRRLLICLAFPFIFLAPIVDEIVGRYQVYRMCENSTWYFNEDTSRNRSVVYGGMSSKIIDKKIITIEEVKRSYIDPMTKEVVIYDIGYMHGNGWLIRLLMKKQKHQSDISACYPKISEKEIFNKLNISEIKE